MCGEPVSRVAWSVREFLARVGKRMIGGKRATTPGVWAEANCGSALWHCTCDFRASEQGAELLTLGTGNYWRLVTLCFRFRVSGFWFGLDQGRGHPPLQVNSGHAAFKAVRVRKCKAAQARSARSLRARFREIPGETVRFPSTGSGRATSSGRAI